VQGHYAESLEWFEKSLKRYEDLKAPHGIARGLNNIGDVYRLQGRRDQALAPLLKSLEMREKIRDRMGIVLTLNDLARLYEEDGKHAEMLAASRRSVQISTELNFPEELWKAQELAGKAQAALGKTAEARQSFQAAINTLETLRRQVAGGEQQQQSFLEGKLSPWLNMTQVLVADREYAEALSFAEQTKARVLLDALQGGRANLRQSLSEDERGREEKLRLELVNINSKLTGEMRKDKPDPALISTLKQELTKARLEYV
jgi:tetratricopeptide (TPR) repeat protein